MASLLESAVLIFKVFIDNSIDIELFVEREVKMGLRHKGQVQTCMSTKACHCLHQLFLLFFLTTFTFSQSF